MENDIPKIDLPQDWVIGKLSIEDIGLLNLYANYPCRLKAGIFVLCLGGEIEASINLTQLKVEPGSFITIMPGSILQIHRADGDLQIYFMGFSSDFLSQANSSKAVIDMHYIVKDNPVYKLKEKAQPLMKDYFELLLKTYEFYATKINRGITNHLFTGMLMGISSMYKDQTEELSMLSKAELISKNFTQLVMQIITSMVIMDAKAQLKSTNLTIHDIAYTLNFTNMSFFGKYFKRHVGMSPQEYRNS